MFRRNAVVPNKTAFS